MEQMISRRLIGHGLAAMVMGCIAAGCSNHSRTKTIDVPSGGAVARGAENEPAVDGGDGRSPVTSTTADQPFSAADAMKRKTSAYSQQIESMIGKTPGGAAMPATGPVGGEGGAVGGAMSQGVGGAMSGGVGSATPQAAGGARGRAPLLPRPSQVRWGDPTAQQPINNTTGGLGSNGPDGSRSNVAAPDGAGSDAQTLREVSSWSNTPVGAKPPLVDPPASPPPGAAGINDAMAQKIEKRMRDYPRDVSGHLDYQLLRFLQDERVPDLEAIASLPTEDRELLAAVVDGLTNFRNGVRQDNNMLLSRKIRPLLEMADRLRNEADLSVPTIALCTDVRTFGEYTPVNADGGPPRFAANRSHEVILYAEIENFSSQLDEKQMWTTRLSKEAVLYTENGMPVWSDKSETIIDRARRRRHDFFIVKKLRLPANLTVGRYLLKVSIQDMQVSRVAEATLPIIVAAE